MSHRKNFAKNKPSKRSKRFRRSLQRWKLRLSRHNLKRSGDRWKRRSVKLMRRTTWTATKISSSTSNSTTIIHTRTSTGLKSWVESLVCLGSKMYRGTLWLYKCSQDSNWCRLLLQLKQSLKISSRVKWCLSASHISRLRTSRSRHRSQGRW